jgi:2-polyprenyl-6-methoxyphenol hydroxylase-like FAD-dependent oxidoreductase
MTTVLVSGASVAGIAMAYWPGRHGYSVTVVERHDVPRPGRQAIDVRGPALTVLERMGLLAAAQAKKTGMRGASFVDADGNELTRDTESTPTGGLIDNPDIEILRDDLVDLLYRATQPSVVYLFSDSITALDDRGDMVAVSFENANDRGFDFTPMFWPIRSWSATTWRQGSRYRSRSSIRRFIRLRSRTTDRERSAGRRR